MFKRVLALIVQTIIKAIILLTILSILEAAFPGAGKALARMMGVSTKLVLGAGKGGGGMPSMQKGGLVTETRPVLVHKGELVAPLSRVVEVVRAIKPPVVNIPAAALAGAGGSKTINISEMRLEPVLTSGYDTREFIEDLSEAIDSEMAKTTLV